MLSLRRDHLELILLPLMQALTVGLIYCSGILAGFQKAYFCISLFLELGGCEPGILGAISNATAMVKAKLHDRKNILCSSKDYLSQISTFLEVEAFTLPPTQLLINQLFASDQQFLPRYP